jgi:protein-S-isoprenylcysteine O-methyltransferase Ste14
MLVTLLGLGLTTANWASLAGPLHRVWVKERVSLEYLGAPYAAYMRRTRRLIPHLIQVAGKSPARDV